MMDEKVSKLLTNIYRIAGLAGAKRQFSELPKLEIKAGGFGRNERWIKDVQEYLNIHLLKFITDITDTMRSDIIKILEKGTAEGMSIDQVVIQLKQLGLIDRRARVIARTEIIRASNVGHSIAAQSTPYEVDKQWIAARDHRTRHSHTYINNHTVGELDPFNVPIYKGDKNTGQFENMQFPGDPEASAANTVNCRCRVIYIPKEDANGNLIMRDRNLAPVIPIRQRFTGVQTNISAQLKSHIRIGVTPE